MLGAQSFNESDGENFFMEENVDKTLSDAAPVVETPTAEMDEEHFTSSSSDSDAESLVLEAPVRVFLPPRALGHQKGITSCRIDVRKHYTWWMQNSLMGLAAAEFWISTLSCPHN